MKVLVTGGAGYIGSVTAQALLAAGHGVVVVDDLSTGHRGAVPEGARLVVADAGDARAMRALMAAEGVEAVMHFAALSLVGDSMREPLRYYRHNVGGAIGLLEACVAAGVGRFVLSSTAAVYGTPDVVPVPETAALRPASVYGETKLAIERLLHWLSVTRGLGYAALRYFNAAGAAPGRTARPGPTSAGRWGRPWLGATPTSASSCAGRAPASPSPPTRCRACEPRCAATRRPPLVPGAGTTPTCSPSRSASPRRRSRPRSSTPSWPPTWTRTSGPTSTASAETVGPRRQISPTPRVDPCPAAQPGGARPRRRGPRGRGRGRPWRS